MKYLKIIIYFNLLIFGCCKNEVNEGIVGMWSIDSIHYKNQDISSCLDVNIIEFRDEFVDLPELNSNCFGGRELPNVTIGKWSIDLKKSFKEEKSLQMSINSANNVFRGDYKVRFVNDANLQLLKMRIQSEDLYLSCRKGYFNYDSNIDLVKALTTP